MKTKIFYFLLTSLFLLSGIGAFAQKRYKVEEIFRPDQILGYNTVNTDKGEYTVVFRDGAKKHRKNNEYIVTFINIITPDYKHVPSVTPNENNLRGNGSIPIFVHYIIYHDLEESGKPDFCSITYHSINVNQNGETERQDGEMIIPDEVAEIILEVVTGHGKWKPSSSQRWSYLTKTEELKGDYR